VLEDSRDGFSYLPLIHLVHVPSEALQDMPWVFLLASCSLRCDPHGPRLSSFGISVIGRWDEVCLAWHTPKHMGEQHGWMHVIYMTVGRVPLVPHGNRG
jgi:hypothetical protein